ncbi:diaminopropionate ammonia-lyase [Nesterenkonia aerolata]|uniref:Diaminopropionate ammonia-lyase n=1 Tax=Nesterenkonia aerolata TaxID=3074079 RepID=A0ABU2DRS8_9MICC|nr:diaminopropionate ammonia-lyase [Nesterenkonia sp. LY-0111]MDR8019076.1 diaminopropionate ammonia-lyase [Nesterenkonia sp. LY-0111]
MNAQSTSPYTHPAARTWRTDPLADSPIDFHRSMPGYAPTPLTSLPALAEELGVGAVLIKDESSRLGLPAFKILGASYAVAWALSRRLGEDDVLPLQVLRDRLADTEGLSLVAATDGNHGRAVAHMARLLGLAATIFVPPGVAEAAREAIVAEGAELIELELSYDDLVAHAAAQADDDALLIQDTSWEGYEEVPQRIVDGYSTLVQEIDESLEVSGDPGPDLVIMPAGVGSLAHAVVHHYRSTAHTPALAVVEPEAAPSVTRALHAGTPVSVDTGETIMMGMNCGTVSGIAWPTLRDGVDVSLTVSDDQARAAVGELRDLGVDSGPCGAATLAGLRRICGDAELRRGLDLGRESVVVLLSTESTAANPKGNN